MASDRCILLISMVSLKSVPRGTELLFCEKIFMMCDPTKIASKRMEPTGVGDIIRYRDYGRVGLQYHIGTHQGNEIESSHCIAAETIPIMLRSSSIL